MATIHSVAKREGSEKWGQALCSSHSVGKAVTSDTTKITCSRCAKILGITAAPKPESNNVQGTCACCFSSQKTKTAGTKSNGKLFHHGYERPGNGYIEGACPGHEFLPYEKSCEGTKYVLAMARMALSVRIENIEILNTCTSLEVTTEINWHYENHKRVFEYTTFTVVPGGAPVEISVPGYCGSKIFTFESEKFSRLNQEESIKEMIERDIKFYEKMIAEWKAV